MYSPEFPINVKPARVGVYQLGSIFGSYHYSLWDGEKWCMSSETALGAQRQTEASMGVAEWYYVKWRGLAKEAKQ